MQECSTDLFTILKKNVHLNVTRVCSGPGELREGHGEGEEGSREEQRLPRHLSRVPAVGGSLDTVRLLEFCVTLRVSALIPSIYITIDRSN